MEAPCNGKSLSAGFGPSCVLAELQTYAKRLKKMFEFTIRESITPFTPFYKIVYITNDFYNNLYSKIR